MYWLRLREHSEPAATCLVDVARRQYSRYLVIHLPSDIWTDGAVVKRGIYKSAEAIDNVASSILVATTFFSVQKSYVLLNNIMWSP